MWCCEIHHPQFLLNLDPPCDDEISVCDDLGNVFVYSAMTSKTDAPAGSKRERGQYRSVMRSMADQCSSNSMAYVYFDFTTVQSWHPDDLRRIMKDLKDLIPRVVFRLIVDLGSRCGRRDYKIEQLFKEISQCVKGPQEILCPAHSMNDILIFVGPDEGDCGWEAQMQKQGYSIDVVTPKGSDAETMVRRIQQFYERVAARRLLKNPQCQDFEWAWR